jgi:CBS domain-containing protein
MSSLRRILEIKGFGVWSVTPETTVFDALRLMEEKNIGVVLVMAGEELLGIFSERDYARQVILKGRASKDTAVKQIMNTPVITAHPEQTTQECMEIMSKGHFRHLPVVEGTKVLGVISMGDVVRDIIFQKSKHIKELQNRKDEHIVA